MIKLSHSSVTKYVECPKSYFYHYVKGYRPKVQSSALLFGTAIDKATEHYLLSKDKKASQQLFESTWERQVVNGVETDLKTLTEFTYGNRDLDLDILNKTELSEINQELLERAIELKNQFGYKNLPEELKLEFNKANWICLRRKGLHMLKEFYRVADENILEVLGTQVEIKLENEDGDLVTGFADAVVRYKGFDKPVILDFKTSGIDYEEDSVKTSPQLSTYVFALGDKYENTKTAGFFVLNKNMIKVKKKVCSVCENDGSGGRHKTCDAVVEGKRCNGEWIESFFVKAKSQIVIDQINEVLMENVVDNFNEVQKGIKAQVFPRCLSNCVKYNGAVVCPYFSLCHEGKMEDLIEKEKV